MEDPDDTVELVLVIPPAAGAAPAPPPEADAAPEPAVESSPAPGGALICEDCGIVELPLSPSPAPAPVPPAEAAGASPDLPDHGCAPAPAPTPAVADPPPGESLPVSPAPNRPPRQRLVLGSLDRPPSAGRASASRRSPARRPVLAPAADSPKVRDESALPGPLSTAGFQKEMAFFRHKQDLARCREAGNQRRGRHLDALLAQAAGLTIAHAAEGTYVRRVNHVPGGSRVQHNANSIANHLLGEVHRASTAGMEGPVQLSDLIDAAVSLDFKEVTRSLPRVPVQLPGKSNPPAPTHDTSSAPASPLRGTSGTRGALPAERRPVTAPTPALSDDDLFRPELPPPPHRPAAAARRLYRLSPAKQREPTANPQPLMLGCHGTTLHAQPQSVPERPAVAHPLPSHALRPTARGPRGPARAGGGFRILPASTHRALLQHRLSEVDFDAWPLSATVSSAAAEASPPPAPTAYDVA